MRPLYFVFSSSSRAPSLATTAPGTGKFKREIQGRTGEENERTEEELDRENTDRDTNIENAKETQKAKKKKQREGRIEKELKRRVASTRQLHHRLRPQVPASPPAAPGKLLLFFPARKIITLSLCKACMSNSRMHAQ